MINNLISNSIRYKAYKQEPIINFKVSLEKGRAKIEVTDNGLGISEKHLKNVFKMFYRANDTNSGSGLGLFIVKETIEKLSGTISIDSTLGEGVHVEINLPSLTP